MTKNKDKKMHVRTREPNLLLAYVFFVVFHFFCPLIISNCKLVFSREKIKYSILELNIYSAKRGEIREKDENYPKFVSAYDSFKYVSFSLGKNKVCYFVLLPGSSMKFKEIKKANDKPYIQVLEIKGNIMMRAKDCLFDFEGFQISHGYIRLREKEEGKIKGIDIIEGTGKYKNQNIGPHEGILNGKIYSLLPSPYVILPKDEQELITFHFVLSSDRKPEKFYIEISTDKDFNFIFSFLKIDSNKFFPEQMTLKALSNKYFFRVWYEDNNFFSSMYSEVKKFKIPNK